MYLAYEILGRKIRLQWGHGHGAVEIPPEETETLWLDRLQWGHCHAAVEIGAGARLRARCYRFNGATATWPWKCGKRNQIVISTVLQWGHGDVAVEAPLHPWRLPAFRGGFNGATATWPWKPGLRGYRAGPCTSFNGATATWPWKRLLP